MEQNSELIASSQSLLMSAQNLLKELEVEREDVDFLTSEYKRNPKYFLRESGRTTIEDVIRTTYEFAWSKCKLFYKINQ